MIDAAVILLWVEGRLPLVALAIILARELLLLGGYKLVVPRGYDFEVNFLGKLATWVLYASLALHDGHARRAPTGRCGSSGSGSRSPLVAAAQYVLKARREVRA